MKIVNDAKNTPSTVVPHTLTTPYENWSTNINGHYYELGYGSNTGNLYENG